VTTFVRLLLRVVGRRTKEVHLGRVLRLLPMVGVWDGACFPEGGPRSHRRNFQNSSRFK